MVYSSSRLMIHRIELHYTVDRVVIIQSEAVILITRHQVPQVRGKSKTKSTRFLYREVVSITQAL